MRRASCSCGNEPKRGETKHNRESERERDNKRNSNKCGRARDCAADVWKKSSRNDNHACTFALLPVGGLRVLFDTAVSSFRCVSQKGVKKERDSKLTETNNARKCDKRRVRLSGKRRTRSSHGSYVSVVFESASASPPFRSFLLVRIAHGLYTAQCVLRLLWVCF